MKFLVQNYSCLQNPWLGATAPRSRFSLSSALNWICWTPPPNKIPGYVTECRRSTGYQYYWFRVNCYVLGIWSVIIWGFCVVVVWGREDVDSKPLMMKDSSNFHILCGACGMLGYTEIKLQILIAKPIKLKWLRLMDFKRLRKIAKTDC